MSGNYDALLVVSFGGPESRVDVMPFLENVLRGRNVPRSRMEEVAEHYYHFDGVSPINAQNRALIAALEKELGEKGPALPIYWGNRNWYPLLTDTVRKMAEKGVRRALALVTSAYSSYSGCRQYREDIAKARAAVGDRAPRIEKLRAFFNHPGFIGANVENLKAALEMVPEDRRSKAALVFSAHSIPLSMAAGCAYEAQLQEVARLVSSAVGRSDYDLVYQSRSGPPHQPWLEPDVEEHCVRLREQGVEDVVLAPIGFISDHMEVLYDLDYEVKIRCDAIGLNLVRVATVGVHPQFVGMIRELVLERMNAGALRRAEGKLGPCDDFCPSDCCMPS